MLRLCILAGLVAAAHADGPRRFLQSSTCLDGSVDTTGLPCTVCDGESAQDFCNCHTDCRETGEDAKFARVRRRRRAASAVTAFLEGTLPPMS